MTGPGGGGSRRRVVVAVAVAIVAFGLIGGGVLVGREVRSPAQAAADAAPPPASVITVPAERRVLAEPIVLRGQIRPGPSTKLVAPPGATGPNSVVTAVKVRQGQALAEGDLVLDISGAPMFALVLQFPLYRDIRGAMSGPDVAEVQRALRRLGYAAPTTSVVDTATQNALAKFYARLGYPSLRADPAATAQVTAAERAVADAEREVGAATGTPAEPEARNRLEAAKSALAQARIAAGPGVARAGVLRLDRSGRKISAIGVSVGSVLADPAAALLELDGQPSFIAAASTPEQAQQIRPQQPVTITDDATGQQITGVVIEVGTKPTGSEDRQAGPEIQVRPADQSFDSAAGRSLRIDIAVSGSPEPVLAVPITAVYSRADGTTFTTMVAADGSTMDVNVVTGRVAGGWVEIRSSAGDGLREGAAVVVGSAGTLR